MRDRNMLERKHVNSIYEKMYVIKISEISKRQKATL